ncbi:MAG: TlpA family protein disulfide reductase [Rhodoferax sp.]
MKTFYSLLCVLLLGLAGPAPLAAAKTPGEVEVGSVLRDVPMQGLSGPSHLLSHYRGKPLIINVWASWCGPCQQEMPSLERLARSRLGQQFAVIGISTDDYRDAALGFLKRYPSSFSHYIDSQLALENMLGANRLPLTLLVDAQGRVLAKHVGAKEWDSLQAQVLIAQTLRLKR